MNIPSANLLENPVKSHKTKNYQKAKGMSFFASLFSIVIYISVFYIFSLSPSSLFSNTKFWFVISNTLILIIAADYGAFSSSKEKLDLHEEYALRSQARSMASSFVTQYPDIAKKSINPKEEEILMISSKDQKKEADIIVADQKNEIVPERILQVVKIEPPEKDPSDNFQPKSQPERENNKHPTKLANKKIKIIEPKRIRRSKSDNVKHVTFHDKKKQHVLKRSETEIKHDDQQASAKEKDKYSSADQEDEFSTMSDEELNRRVEEFIQKFNQQIRLQGARNRQLLEYE